jgi:predicted nucleotidyltransferase
MGSILWAVPVVAFMMALARMARLHGFSRSKKLVREEALLAKLSIAASTEAPALASRQPQVPEIPGPVFTAASPAETAELARGDFSREIFQPLCSKFQIVQMSLLPSRPHPGARKEPNLQILVKFDPNTRVDYPTFFRLRNELLAILGRRVDLVCKNSAELVRQREAFAKARVLYAA